MRSQPGIAAGVVVGALALFVSLGWLVLAGATKEFDEAVRLFLYRNASPGLTLVMRFCTGLGAYQSLLILGAGAVAALWLSGMPRAALFFVATMAGSAGLEVTLKHAFERARPEAFFGTVLPSGHSFPSGHALQSMCFFGFLAAVASTRIASRTGRAALWTAASGIILLIGISRIYLGVHYPTDVLAGYAAAIAWCGVPAWGYRLSSRGKRGPG